MTRRESGPISVDYGGVFRDIPVGLVVTDLDGVIVDINQYCVDLIGWSSVEEAIGQDTFKFNDDPEHMQSMLERLKKDGRIENELLCLRRLDGTLRWVRNNVIMRRDNEGEPLWFESSFIDVTRERHYLILLDLQSELTDFLNKSSNASEASERVLQYCTSLPGVDTAGVYLLDEEGENLVLEAHTYLSEGFIEEVRTESASWLREMFPDLGVQEAHASSSGYREELVQAEGIRGILCAFIEWDGELIGSVNLTSKTLDRLPSITTEIIKLLVDNIAAHLHRLRKLRMLERQEMFYRTMHRESPVATLNLDMSDILKTLRELAADIPDGDVAPRLRHDRDMQQHLMSRLKILSCNQEFFKLMETSTSRIESDFIVALLTEEAWGDLVELIGVIFAGQTRYEMETVLQTGGGRRKQVFMRFVVVPGRENDWKSVMVSFTDISVLTETINALRESLMYNRGLLSSIPDMFFVLDSQRRIKEFKEPAEVTLYIDSSDLLHRKLSAFHLDNEELETLESLVTRTNEQFKTHHMRLHLSSHQGRRMFEARMAPLGDDETLILARDITEVERQFQKRLEAEGNLIQNLQLQETLSTVSREFNRFEGLDLESQMARIGAAMNLDAVSLFLIETDSRVVLKRGWVSKEEYYRKDLLQDLDPMKYGWWMSKMNDGLPVTIDDIHDVAIIAAPERNLMTENGLRALIGMPVVLTGETAGFVTFGIIGRAHKWSQQEVQALRFSTELITNWLAREQAIASLRESEEMFRNLADRSPNMIFINQGGRVVYANKECETLMGYTREEFLDENFNFMSLIHPSSQFLVRQNFRRHREGEEVPPYEYRLSRKDGSRVDAILASKLTTFRGEPALMGIITDISARKAMELQLRRINEDLEQFVYVASHDLQEPLRGISSYMELLQERYSEDLDEKGRLFIERAGVAAGRLQGMIDGLLAYSRIASHDLPHETVDLDLVLDEVISTMPSLQGVPIHKDSLPSVCGDTAQLQSVFRNLLSNAVKYCERDPEIRIAVEEREHRVVIKIHDNGIGINEAYLEEIFDIFRRLHTFDKYPGSGIGLATCLKIIERHGGLIWAESTPGVGSTFVIELPTGSCETRVPLMAKT